MVLFPSLKSVTCFTAIGKTMVLTRTGMHRKRCRHVSFVLTVGKPNYSNRAYQKKNPTSKYRAVYYAD